MPLPANLLDELAAFPSGSHLFARMDGQPGPPSAMRVSERINDHLHVLGICGTAHALRHRFGTRLYEALGDPLLVGEVMGHSSTDTTRIYIQIQPRRAAAGIEPSPT